MRSQISKQVVTTHHAQWPITGRTESLKHKGGGAALVISCCKTNHPETLSPKNSICCIIWGSWIWEKLSGIVVAQGLLWSQVVVGWDEELDKKWRFHIQVHSHGCSSRLHVIPFHVCLPIGLLRTWLFPQNKCSKRGYMEDSIKEGICSVFIS